MWRTAVFPRKNRDTEEYSLTQNSGYKFWMMNWSGIWDIHPVKSVHSKTKWNTKDYPGKHSKVRIQTIVLFRDKN